MDKLHQILRITIIILSIGFIFLLLLFALRAEDFWTSLSLNLLTEIAGVILIAVYLKSNLRNALDDLSLKINDSLDRMRITEAFRDEDAEEAWRLVLRAKYRRLKKRQEELRRTDPSDVEARKRLAEEVELLEAYIRHAGAQDLLLE
ncbi:MAG: hypothetical protein WBW48_10430 [Anaerolineae bacterium]